MGFVFNKKFYFHCTLSMGSRSSAPCCQRVTNAVVFIYTNQGYFAINYLDDLGGAEHADKVDTAFIVLRELLKNFGLDESTSKSCSPSHIMIFLGIEVNTLLLTLTIPVDKLNEILRTLEQWGNKSTATQKEVQQLAGLLNFACHCVRSGRVYLAQILSFLHSFKTQESKQVPPETFADIQWWREFAPSFNGVSCMLENEWGTPDLLVESDSCLTGGGACTQQQYFHFEFTELVLDRCKYINELECVVLTLALKKWGPKFGRKRIQIHCDNKVTVATVNTGTSRNEVIQACLREIHKLMGWYSFDLKAKFLAGALNRRADVLSRWHLNSRSPEIFSQLNGGKVMHEIHVKPDISHFCFRNKQHWCTWSRTGYGYHRLPVTG